MFDIILPVLSIQLTLLLLSVETIMRVWLALDPKSKTNQWTTVLVRMPVVAISLLTIYTVGVVYVIALLLQIGIMMTGWFYTKKRDGRKIC